MTHPAGWKTEEELQAEHREQCEARRITIAADPTIASDTDVYHLEPGTLSRVEYEATCQRYRVAPAADKECDTYGVKYGDFRTSWGYTREFQVDMALRRLRQNGLRRDRPTAQPRTRSPETGTCSHCGNGVTRITAMAGSLGVLCPDCYDTVEAEL